MSKLGINHRPDIRPRLDIVEAIVGHDVVIDVIEFDIQCFFNKPARLEAIRIDQRANELAIMLFKLSERGTQIFSETRSYHFEHRAALQNLCHRLRAFSFSPSFFLRQETVR